MNVIDDIESGKLFARVWPNRKDFTTPECDELTTELLRLAKLGAAMQWVPVSEMLPEEDQLVLVVNGKWFNLRHFCDDTWFNCLSGEGFELNEYTHWMPLPPLPETIKEVCKDE